MNNMKVERRKPTLTALRRNDSSWSFWAAFVNPHHAEKVWWSFEMTVGLATLGTGLIYALFHWNGTTPFAIDLLNRSVITLANRVAPESQEPEHVPIMHHLIYSV